MVFNGEIYNYVELGAELREQGVVLRSSCDSEVLLETYARVGKDVVHRLRGMFAFAIWDTQTRELFCARDQFGIKPFYYSVAPGPGANDPFQGSGAAAGGPVSGPGDGVPPFGPDEWLDPRRRPARGGREPDRSAAPARLPGGRSVAPARRGPSGCCGSRPSARPWPTGRTARSRPQRAAQVPGLRVCPTARHRDSAGTGAAARPRHDRPARRDAGRLPLLAAEPRPASAPASTTSRAILDVMRDSIAVHLRSDAPLGAFLSGGVDSATICALAAEQGRPRSAHLHGRLRA